MINEYTTIISKYTSTLTSYKNIFVSCNSTFIYPYLFFFLITHNNLNPNFQINNLKPTFPIIKSVQAIVNDLFIMLKLLGNGGQEF